MKLIISIFILIATIVLSMFFIKKETFQNDNKKLLNINVPPNIPNRNKYFSNKVNLENINFSNDNLDLKSNKNSEVMCFPKPVFKYDGIWNNDIQTIDNKYSIQEWNFNNKINSKYCGQSPSFGHYDASIDNRYKTDDDCEGEPRLKLCISDYCEDIYMC